MKDQGTLAFKFILVAIAVVLTATWIGSAYVTWPKAYELTEVHDLTYPAGQDFGVVVKKVYPAMFQEQVQNGTVTQVRTIKAAIEKSSSNFPPYQLVVQGKEKGGPVWETQIMGEVNYLNFGGVYPTYNLDQATMADSQVTIKLRLTDSWWSIHAGIAALWLFLAACLAVTLREL